MKEGIKVSTDTVGRIKGYISADAICSYIRNCWDPTVESNVKRSNISSIKKITWKYLINEHSETSEYWYVDTGIIKFCYKGQERWLHYCYNNLNHFENLEYYKNLGLEEMERSEYTNLILAYFEDSAAIMQDIIKHFGGGWLDENDEDGIPFIELKGERIMQTEKERKYILELNETQIVVLKEVLEEYFRIRMNQWNMLAESLTLQSMGLSTYAPNDKELFERYLCKRDYVQLALETVGRMLGWDYHAKQTKEQLVAQDIWQVVRHELWKNQENRNEWCVDSREPLAVSAELLPGIKTIV